MPVPRRRHACQEITAAIGLTIAASSAAAFTLTTSSWASPTSGLWSDASRWSTAPLVPNNDAPNLLYYFADLSVAGPSYAAPSPAPSPSPA